MGDVRGLGLMPAIEFVRHNKQPAPDLALTFLQGLKNLGILIALGGLWNSTARLAPPMTVTNDEVRRTLAAMAETIENIYQAEPDLKTVPPTRLVAQPGA